MAAARFEIRALVLRVGRFSETSQTASLWSAERGQISVLAKGIMRPQAGLLGPLDLLQVVRAEVLERPHGEQQVLTALQIEDGFRGLRGAWTRLAGALHLLEVLRAGIPANVPDPVLFERTLLTLAGLARGPLADVPARVLGWRLAFLRAFGCAPVLDRCVFCQRVAPERSRGAFSPAQGGIVCGVCRERHRTATVPLPAPARRRAIALSEPARAADEAGELDAETARILERWSGDFLQRTLDQPLKTRPWLASAVDAGAAWTYDPA